MKVRDLKKALENLPDDVEVVFPEMRSNGFCFASATQVFTPQLLRTDRNVFYHVVNESEEAESEMVMFIG